MCDTARVDLVASLGADRVVDYTREDYTAEGPVYDMVGPHRVRVAIPSYTQDAVLQLKELIEAGEYRAIVDRTYPLEDIVEATRYVETEQKTGNVVITLGN